MRMSPLGRFLTVSATFTIAAATIVSLNSPRPSSVISVSASPPSDAAAPLRAFISYSIEFSSFPDFAGNLSSPNTFSNNLLNTLAEFSGTKPYIRVGGNTQDYAIFNASLDVASVGIVDPAKSPDYPTTLTIGPAFFESYQTWPNTKFIHGFNLAKNTTSAREALLASVPYACKALRTKLAHWELGNEPDLYKTSAQGHVRPANWTEQDYVDEWLHWSRAIRVAMSSSCPDLTSPARYNYYAPSFGGTGNSLDIVRTWEDGLDADNDVGVITSHNYISGATVPGVTLQGTLMNHTSTILSIAKQLNVSRLLSPLHAPPLPFILGETNSLYNQGRPGLSNTFGAALWALDFAVYCASTSTRNATSSSGIRRLHFHQGTNYRYQSWQPIGTNLTSLGTKAPYYGNVAAAAFLGDIDRDAPRVVALPLPDDRESAYALYDAAGQLARLLVVNMMGYNTTSDNVYVNDYSRPVERYSFALPAQFAGRGFVVQRLLANGSDAVTGVTFDGFSYEYELDEGRPVLLGNVTRGEVVEAGQEESNLTVLSVDVMRSSAAILRSVD